MYLLLSASMLASRVFASATGNHHLFIRQDVGCALTPCVTADCDLIQCGSPGWGVPVDCTCCGGLVGCNIPLGHTCGTQDGQPVCFTGNNAASSAGASAPASSSIALAASSSSSSPAASSSSPPAGNPGSSQNPGHASKNSGSSSAVADRSWWFVGAAEFAWVFVYLLFM